MKGRPPARSRLPPTAARVSPLSEKDLIAGVPQERGLLLRGLWEKPAKRRRAKQRPVGKRPLQGGERRAGWRMTNDRKTALLAVSAIMGIGWPTGPRSGWAAAFDLLTHGDLNGNCGIL